jgi:hypothetical protein
MKRHPDAHNWNLELKDVGDDILPEEIFVGWNTIGNDAIITLLHGESLANMRVAQAGVEKEEVVED